MQVLLKVEEFDQYERLKAMPASAFSERLEQIEGRLIAEGASLDSNWRLICAKLENTVLPYFCIAIAAIAMVRYREGQIIIIECE